MADHKILRQILFHEQNGVCYLCGFRMTMKRFRDNTCTVDHVVPQCKGGREVKGACLSCNNKKGDMDAETYKVLIGRGPFAIMLASLKKTPAD